MIFSPKREPEPDYSQVPVTLLTPNTSPSRTKRVTVKSVVKIEHFLPPDLKIAPLGARIRYIRRRFHIPYTALAAGAGISPNTVLRLERGEAKTPDWAISRLLRYLGPKLAEAFPGTDDVYDFLIPPKDFGSWLRNFRLRRGMQQKDMAKALRVHKVTICRYEKNVSKPNQAVLERLTRRMKLNGEFERYL